MQNYKLPQFRIKQYDNKIAILNSGNDIYLNILRETYHHLKFSRIFNDAYSGFDWGVYVYNPSIQDQQSIEDLLVIFRQVVCIDDALSQTFALDYHGKPFMEGGGRTDIAELVYQAKPYRATVTQKHYTAAQNLSRHFEQFIQTHPLYRNADFIVSPPYRGQKSFDLPAYLVESSCVKLSKKNGNPFLLKRKDTQSMKDLQTLQEKIENIEGAFQLKSEHPFQDTIIILIDYIYHSGSTLHELATELQKAGAKVLGLTATKTISSPS